MKCCQETNVEVGPEKQLDLYLERAATQPLTRRSLIKGAGSVVGMAGVAVATGGAAARAQTSIKLAFCSQLLCVVPYEVTRAQEFFSNEGLDVELVYTRGGNAAMQALIGGAVDYAATSFDVAVQAFAKGADVRRFCTTGRLPLFALAVGPANADTITDLKGLEGKIVGVSALGNADHTLLLYLLKQAGADASKVEFAVLGPNLFEALNRNQVQAGMVQEPSLSMIVANGGRVLFNAMDIADAKKYLGGPYEFMGVAVRGAERDDRLEQMRAVARALQAGLKFQREAPIAEVRKSIPPELLAGGEGKQFDAIVGRYRESLYPESVAIDVSACERVVNALKVGGALAAPVDLSVLLDTAVVPA
jgi:NitT/TauT family transport system substrate-binding protein